MTNDKKFKIKSEIRIEADIFYSPAFQCLSRSTMIALMRCLQKRKWEFEKIRGKKRMIYTNDEFIFPYAEAALLGIGTTQHWKNMIKLIEVGFLDLAYQGGSFQKYDHEKDYSRYKLSNRWRDYGTPLFREVNKPKVLRRAAYILENIKRQKLKTPSQTRRHYLHKCEGDGHKTVNTRFHESEGDKAQQKTAESLVSNG